MKRIQDKLFRILDKMYIHNLLGKIFGKSKLEVDIVRCGNAYGGFNVETRVFEQREKQASIVYSFGIGEDLSFSEDLINKFSCELFAFDPTPKAISYVKDSELIDLECFHFFPWGLSDSDGVTEFHLPQNDNYVSGSAFLHEGVKEQVINVEMKRLQSIMEELGHNEIDLLKMDIEGSEFVVIKDILESELLIKEICLEIHNRFFSDGHKLLKNMFDDLKKHGYELANYSKSGEEITFIK